MQPNDSHRLHVPNCDEASSASWVNDGCLVLPIAADVFPLWGRHPNHMGFEPFVPSA